MFLQQISNAVSGRRASGAMLIAYLHAPMQSLANTVNTLQASPSDQLSQQTSLMEATLVHWQVSIASLVAICVVVAVLCWVLLLNRRIARSRELSEQVNRRLASIIEGTGAGTWEWNVRTGELKLNGRWAQMLGRDIRSLMPTTMDTWRSLIHPDDLPGAEAALQEHLTGKSQVYDVEFRLLHVDGHWVWVHSRGRLLDWDASGEPVWMFGTHVDISSRYANFHERDALLDRFEDLWGNVPGMLYQFRLRPDGSMHLPFCNHQVEDIFGVKPEQVRNDAAPLFARIVKEDHEDVLRAIATSHREMSRWHVSFRVIHPALGQRWVEGNATPAKQKDGSVLWHGYIRDITELRRGREQVRLAASVFEASREGIVIMSPEGKIIDVNPALRRMLGYELHEMMNEAFSTWLSAPTEDQQYDAISQALVADGFWQGEVNIKSRDSEALPVLMSVAQVRGESGQVEHHVAVLSDIRVMKAHERELETIAHYDVLTGIPNRRLFSDRLAQAMAYAIRTGQTLAICMLDLDDFKGVNDSLGLETGDRLLIEVAQRLRQLIRAEDTVARLGGDEFVLLLVNPDGVAVFERILKSLSSTIKIDDHEIRISASLGVTYLDHKYPADGDQLLRQADKALYRSKADGRNRYTISDS